MIEGWEDGKNLAVGADVSASVEVQPALVALSWALALYCFNATEVAEFDYLAEASAASTAPEFFVRSTTEFCRSGAYSDDGRDGVSCCVVSKRRLLL